MGKVDTKIGGILLIYLFVAKKFYISGIGFPLSL